MRKVDVEAVRQAERAEAVRLGGEFGLGDNIGVAWVRYSRHGSAFLGVVLLGSASVLTLPLTIVTAFSSIAGAVALGLLTVAEIVGVRRLNRRIRSGLVRRRFCWYSDGVVQTHPDRQVPDVLRWADVDAVTLTFNDADERFNGLSWCALASDAGTTVAIDGAYPKSTVREVVDLADRLLSPRITAALIGTFESGEPVVMGTWRIDATGVTQDRAKSRSFTWPEIREITVLSEDHSGLIDPPSLITITPKSGKRGLWLSLSGVRNGMFLSQVLEHVARQQQVAIRSTAVPPGKGGT